MFHVLTVVCGDMNRECMGNLVDLHLGAFAIRGIVSIESHACSGCIANPSADSRDVNDHRCRSCPTTFN